LRQFASTDVLYRGINQRVRLQKGGVRRNVSAIVHVAHKVTACEEYEYRVWPLQHRQPRDDNRAIVFDDVGTVGVAVRDDLLIGLSRDHA